MIKLENITVTYSEKKIFDNFTGSFEFNNLNVLIGKNGIGKSTLLDVISNLTPLDSGTLKNIPEVNNIMYMFQSTPFNTNITVTQLLEMYKAFGRETSFNFYNIKNIKDFFQENILPISKQTLGKLSGGEIKLVFTYASAMVLKKLYLFDEPLSGVDIENQEKIVKLLEDLGKKVPVIITSHELEPFKGIDSTLKYISSKNFLFTGSYDNLIEKYGSNPNVAFLNLTKKMRGENNEYYS